MIHNDLQRRQRESKVISDPQGIKGEGVITHFKKAILMESSNFTSSQHRLRNPLVPILTRDRQQSVAVSVRHPHGYSLGEQSLYLFATAVSRGRKDVFYVCLRNARLVLLVWWYVVWCD
jgi:hypothetical protein